MRSPGLWALILTLTLISGCALDLAGRDCSLKAPKMNLQAGTFFPLFLFRLSVAFDSAAPWTAAPQASQSLTVSRSCSDLCPLSW